MKRLLNHTALLIVAISLFTGGNSLAARRSQPWPDIHLSTLPSVVGAANSWEFEINQRSPVYLSDLDKMYVSLAYGWGKNTNELPNRIISTDKYGYAFYNSHLDYKIYDFKFNIYSNLSRKTFGSLWVNYGKRKNRFNDESIVVSTPSSMQVKTAFAWKVAPKVTLGISGSINNWPRSLVFVFQPQDYDQYQPKDLPADVGENLVGEFDVMYRPNPSLDIIVGGMFQNIYTKFNPSDSIVVNGSISTRRDTAEVKEYIYSGAPRIMVRKTFSTGDYIRAGAAYYFNLFDYQFRGAREYSEPSFVDPSYRSQELSSFIPKWKIFADGSKVLGSRAALYLCGEFAGYPNALSTEDTQWAPLRQSLVDLVDLSSGAFTAELSGKLTRILDGMVGIEVRYFDNGDSNPDLDSRSMYASVKVGTTTRFYRNLWWSVRVPGYTLYTSEALGSEILFSNRTYIETDILFLGL